MTDDTKLIQYIEVILVHLGYDTDSPLFKDTALRFASRMRPFFANAEQPAGSIIGASVDEHEEMPQVSFQMSPIPFTAMCARHFMPIFGSVGLQYIPTTKKAHVRALHHAVEYYTEQFIDQETVTLKLFEELAVGLDPACAYVVVSARHTCEGNAVITTDYGARLTPAAAQSLIERVESSLG